MINNLKTKEQWISYLNENSPFKPKTSLSTTSEIDSLFNKEIVKKGKVDFTKSPIETEFKKGSKGVKPNPMSGETLSAPKSLSVSLSQITTPFTAGTVDFSFPNGPDYGFDGDVYDIVIQPDGKIIVGGDFSGYYYDGNYTYSPYLIRLNSDGTWDDTFDTTYDWDCYGGGLNGTVNTIALQSDGKILVGGYFSNYDRDGYCDSANYIIRLNSDASRDVDFFIGNGFDNNVTKIVIQPNGKILVGGSFGTYNSNSVNGIIRLNNDGSIDSSFNNGTIGGPYGIGGFVFDILLQNSGKIIIGGKFASYNDINTTYNCGNILRINSDGTFDTTFQSGLGIDGGSSIVYTLALQSDGKIIVGGDFDTYDNNYLYGGYIVRLGVDGNLDKKFGYGLSAPVYKIIVQSDDKILVGGDMYEYYPTAFDTLYIDELVRFQADCSFDYSFYYEELFNSSVYALALNSSNQILVGGAFYENIGSDPRFVLNYFGRLNNEILVYPYVYLAVDCNYGYEYNTTYYTIGSFTPLQVLGDTYSFQSLQNPSITKCGFVIPVFPSTSVDYVYANTYPDCDTALTNNAKMVLVQDCYDTFSVPEFILLVSNNYKVGDIGYFETIYQGMGQFYFKSTFTIIEEIPYNTSYPLYVAAPILPYVPYQSCEESVEGNGVMGLSFDCLSGNYDLMVTYQSNTIFNKIMAVPYGDSNCKEFDVAFSYIPYEFISGGTPTIKSTLTFDTCEQCLVQTSNKGLIDEHFYDGGFTDFDGIQLVYTIVEQPDGKLLVGGNFTEYDGTFVNNFMRINPDGTLDNTFIINGFDNYVRAIALQPDGKILVGGNFDYCDGEFAGKIVRLNSDGSIDQSFTYASEFNGIVRAIAVQDDGKILVGGNFTYYYDFYCPKIVRLNSDGTPDTTFVMGDGFDGNVYVIKIESRQLPPPFFVPAGYAAEYEYTYLVGGNFDTYNNQTSGAIAAINGDGVLLSNFGEGFTDYQRVFDIKRQSDGKLIIVGIDLYQYNYNDTPANVIRLNSDYTLDTTWKTPTYYDDNGGFDSWVISVQPLSNGQYLFGGQFGCYTDNLGQHCSNSYIMRINSDGSFDDTFTLNINDNYVNKVLLLSNGQIILGGWFQSPTQNLLKFFPGGQYNLYEFTPCSGTTSYTFLPYNSSLVKSLDIVFQGNEDDSNYSITLPLPFDVNFLSTNYTEVQVSTNGYIAFGSGGDPSSCCFDIPNDIPAEVSLPGVYLSVSNGDNSSTGMDAQLYTLYSGITSDGSQMIIRYEGSYHSNQSPTPNLIYNFIFYKDQSEYFDLIIESNVYFFNDDPTGGTNDGINGSWIDSFDSSSENSYRINYDGSITTLTYSPLSINPFVKTNVNVCGQIGNIVTEPTLTGGFPGSMYFDGNDSTAVTVDYSVDMDLDYDSWTVEWFQYYTSTNTCCLRVFDIGSFATEQFGVSLEDDNLYLWLAYNNGGGQYTFPLNSPIYNTWVHFAITSEDIGYPNRTIRVFQNGTLLDSITFNQDLNNFYPNPGDNLPLTIGGEGNGGSSFKGYITNFRWNKGTCYYTSNFTVPTSPLTVDGSQLLLLATDEANIITDSSSTQTISKNNVTWSDKNPFANGLDMYNITDTTIYDNCNTCSSSIEYKVKLYVRDGNSTNDYVSNDTMTKTNIDNVFNLGPIFTTGGRECYEIINYYPK